MRKINYPGGGWIGLPDEWLGLHAVRQKEAQDKARQAGLPEPFANLAVALALLDDWGELPGMDGNPERWDYNQIRWALMNWITTQVFTDLSKALHVPKAMPATLRAGSRASGAKQATG